MSDENTPVTETTAETTPSSRSGKFGLAFGVIVIAAGLFGYGYFQLAKMNASLADEVRDLQVSVQTNETALSTLKAAFASQANNESASQVSTAEAPNLLTDKNRWVVAEAQYLVNAANDQLQYLHNPGLALVLLQRAEQTLAETNDTSVDGLRQAVQGNITTLTAAPAADITALYNQLNTLNATLDQMPLPATPLQENADTDNDKVNVEGLPWWKAEWRRTMHTLGRVVIVRYNGGNTPPLILPEERVFIYQNLHAQMENALWALLSRDQGIYQAALMRMHDWIARYFNAQSAETTAVLTQLQTLASQNIGVPSVNLAGTQQQFANYLNKQGGV